MKLYVGIDWSDASLEYHIRDAGGKEMGKGSVEVGVNGLAELFGIIERHDGGGDVLICAETSHGAWVQALLDRGYRVYPVNPKLAERFRESMTVAGSKSDKLDAKVLAMLLMSFEGQLRPLKPDDPEIIALRLACQDRLRLVEERTAKLNELTAVLKAYYPAYIGLFWDLDSEVSLSFLQEYPTQRQFEKLSEKAFVSWLRRHKYSRADWLAKVLEIRRKPALSVAEHLQDVKASLVRYLASNLRLLNEEIADRDEDINAKFSSLPESQWISSLPGVGKVLGPALLACIGRDASRFEDISEARAFMGTAPVTRASGLSSVVHFRRGCWKFGRRTLQLFADLSRTKAGWAAVLYRKQRNSGHGHHAAIRAVAHKWLKIILAMQRTGKCYDEALFVGSRQKYLSMQVN